MNSNVNRVLGHSLGCGLHFLSQSKTHMIKQWVWWHKVSWHVFAGLGLGVRKCGWSIAEIAYNSLTSKLLDAKHSPLHFFFAHCQWVIHEGHSPIDFWEVGGNMPEKTFPFPLFFGCVMQFFGMLDISADLCPKLLHLERSIDDRPLNLLLSDLTAMFLKRIQDNHILSALLKQWTCWYPLIIRLNMDFDV